MTVLPTQRAGKQQPSTCTAPRWGLMAEVPEDVRAAARWLAYQPLTLPDHVADHLDVVLAYVLGHTTREGTPRYLITHAGATRSGRISFRS
jgi:hypothetical protein